MNDHHTSTLPTLYPCHLPYLHLHLFFPGFSLSPSISNNTIPHFNIGKDDNSSRISQVLHSFQTSSIVSSVKSHFVFRTFQNIKSLKMWNIIFFSDQHCSLNDQCQVYNGRHCRPVLIRPNLSGYFPPKLKNVSLTRLIRSSQTTSDRRKFWKQNQDFLTK